MSMMLELSSRMIDYLPEEVSKIQRTIELAASETLTEEEMFAKVDSVLTTKHLREGAREFWDVWSNASDYAEPLTEGVGGFPIDKSVLQKNRAKDRNIGRLMDVNGQQVMVINKRSNGDMVVIDKMGKRSVKKAEGLGVTRTEKVELNVLDQLDEEDLSGSESPNGKKKAGKTTVIVNPKSSDLMKEAKKVEKKGRKFNGKNPWWDSDGDGKAYEPGQDVRKEEVEEIDENSYAMRNPEQYENEQRRNQSSRQRRMNDPNTGINSRAFNDFYNAQMASKKKKTTNTNEEYVEEGKNKAGKEQGADGKACWKGYKYAGTENGKDKCEPMEEYIDLVNQMLEEGYDEEQVRDVLANLEEGYEVIFEEDGYTVQSSEYLEEHFYEDVELVANWLQEEGIIENEDEFFELMEELSEEEIEEIYDVVMEATAMAKRGYDETKLRQRAGGGEAADRATSLENRPTYGDANKAQQRQRYARAQRGDYRKTASSNPGLHGYAHKSNDPEVQAKQKARGAQRGALTPNEKKNLNMGMEMIGNSLEEGGMEVRTYSWREVMGIEEGWKGAKKGGKK
jgi:hypothetical protein